MSIYKPKNSRFWHFDFVFKGCRYHGSTGCASERDARSFEAAERRKAALGLTERPQISLGDAVDQWWLAKGQYSRATGTFGQLESLVKELGRGLPLQDITVLRLDEYVARRRFGRKNSTVNREVELLRRVINWCAARDYRVPVVKWGAVLLTEPPPNHRELTREEEARLFAVIDQNLAPILEFALLTGLRKAEIIELCWSDVDLSAGRATVRAKGNRPHTIPLTARAVALIANQPKACPQIFTYICERNAPARKDRPRRIKGQRYPFSKGGWARKWYRALKAAKIDNYTFHHNRHTLGTRALRASGNLRAVQLQLGHADIRTTTRYAHALESDVRAMLEAAEAAGAATDSRNSPEAATVTLKKPNYSN
jgi:integrase